MNDLLDIAEPELKPAFWYGLPHGYRQLDLQPTAEGLTELARQINELPAEARDRADQVFRLYAMVVMMLQKQQVQGCALGMHPDDSGGAALSVLTVSSVATTGVSPKVVLAKLLDDSTATGVDSGVRPVELPVGTGFLIESEHRTVAPGVPPEGQEEPLEGTIWRGMVAIPDTTSSSVITVQMVTGSLELADDYREVLLGTARTVTFTDPAAAEGQVGSGSAAPGTSPGSAEDSIRNAFG
ncbi:hypothetical protein [Streptomyces sp. NPDC017993]|uniref:hypothetical protein n=1 Tax=Streptomyces sp. NPDC017993 TaxID=3365027 RepID=UPI0037A1FC2D